MEYDPDMSKVLWEALEAEFILSAPFVQRKFNLSFREADHIITEFNKREVIPLHKWRNTEEYRQFTCIFHVKDQNIKKEKRKCMIVVIGGTKGGVGKSTLAVNLVTIHASKGKRVLFVDADEQRSSSRFFEHRQNLGIKTPWENIQLAGRNVVHEVRKKMAEYDEIIIDAGGRDTTSHRCAMLVGNIYVAPFKPGFFDIETIEDIEKMLELNASNNPSLKVFAMLNQADFRGPTNNDAIRLLKEGKYWTVMNSIIRNRVSIRNSISDGLGIIETKIKEQKAIQEITDFFNEIYGDQTNGTTKEGETSRSYYSEALNS